MTDFKELALISAKTLRLSVSALPTVALAKVGGKTHPYYLAHPWLVRI